MTIIILFNILWIILAHWYADFVFQTHWQASNKSKNWNALTRHVFVYTLIMTLSVAWMYSSFTEIFNNSRTLLLFASVTYVAHFVTDAITSRISSRLFAKQDYHKFFEVVGFDQFLHYTQLFLTLMYLSLI
jgi:hypothetical protein